MAAVLTVLRSVIRAVRTHIVPAVPSVSGTSPLTQEVPCAQTEFGILWLGSDSAHNRPVWQGFHALRIPGIRGMCMEDGHRTHLEDPSDLTIFTHLA